MTVTTGPHPSPRWAARCRQAHIGRPRIPAVRRHRGPPARRPHDPIRFL